MYPDYAKKDDGYIDFRNEPKTKFCHFLYSNSYAKERIVFAQKLMQYKKVDCMGEVLNNMPQYISVSEYCQDISILKDLKNYKFGIAFENHLREHYTYRKNISLFFDWVQFPSIGVIRKLLNRSILHLLSIAMILRTLMKPSHTL